MKIRRKPVWTKTHMGELFQQPLRLLSGAEVCAFADIRNGQKKPYVVVRPPLYLLEPHEQAAIKQAIHAKLTMQYEWDKGRHRPRKDPA